MVHDSCDAQFLDHMIVQLQHAYAVYSELMICLKHVHKLGPSQGSEDRVHTGIMGTLPPHSSGSKPASLSSCFTLSGLAPSLSICRQAAAEHLHQRTYIYLIIAGGGGALVDMSPSWVPGTCHHIRHVTIVQSPSSMRQICAVQVHHSQRRMTCSLQKAA